MQRLDGNFGQAAGPLTMPGQDPNINSGTTIANITTVDLGNGVLQRSINLAAASGTITLNETPLGGTLVIYQGTVVLPPAGYTVAGNAITFPQALSGVTLSIVKMSVDMQILSTIGDSPLPPAHGTLSP